MAQLDINLYRVLEAIYSEGSLTAAAKLLHKSQPALSYSLGRLRDHLQDPLFVREGRRLQPTPRTRLIINDVRVALRQLDGIATPTSRFQPEAAEIEFRVGMRDALQATALPRMMAILQEVAPGIRLTAVQVSRRQMAARLATGNLDLALDVRLNVSGEIRHQHLIDDALVVLGRGSRKKMSLQDYLARPHALVSSREQGPGLEDFGLQRLGVSRKIVMRCQHYLAACRTAAVTDLLVTLPTSQALLMQQQVTGLRLWAMPADLPPVDLHMYWHQRSDEDSASRWLRQLIVAEVRRG